MPFVWPVAPLGAAACLFIMVGLPRQAWERFGIWLVIGIVLYYRPIGFTALAVRQRLSRQAEPVLIRTAAADSVRPPWHGDRQWRFRPCREISCTVILWPTTGLRCAARASTTSRTSTSICPRDQLVVITGLSGSGKSSLAFDTIYAEGQRRYVESLSSYARQFLEQMEKPDVDLIDGLSPAISIEQKTTGSNPRSTVGTVTEIYDYLRLLFANIGVPHCHLCGREIASQSLERIIDMVMLIAERRAHQRARAGRPRPQGGVQEGARGAARSAGSPRSRVDGQLRSLDEDIKLDRRRNHTIDVVVDRLILKPGIERRLTESVEIALKLADDIVVINTLRRRRSALLAPAGLHRTAASACRR